MPDEITTPDYTGPTRRESICDNHARVGELLDFKARNEAKIEANCVGLKRMQDKGVDRRGKCGDRFTRMETTQGKFKGGMAVACVFLAIIAAGVGFFLDSTDSKAEEAVDIAGTVKEVATKNNTNIQLMQKDIKTISTNQTAIIKKLDAQGLEFHDGIRQQTLIMQAILDKLPK